MTRPLSDDTAVIRSRRIPAALDMHGRDTTLESVQGWRVCKGGVRRGDAPFGRVSLFQLRGMEGGSRIEGGKEAEEDVHTV